MKNGHPPYLEFGYGFLFVQMSVCGQPGEIAGMRMTRAVLHVLSDRQRHAGPLERTLADAVAGGADIVQIRDKRAPAADVFALCRAVGGLLAEEQLPGRVFVNDRLDVALAANLAGVHLAVRSLPVAAVCAVRARAGWRGLVGVSVHSIEEAVAAESQGADYVTYGHIYASETHRGEAPRGVRALARVVDAVRLPVIAIGGVDATNIDLVLETGCAGVAVIGAILETPEPRRAAMALRSAMERSQSEPRFAFPEVCAKR